MGSVHLVKASAGSGKTYRLTYEYIERVIRSPRLYRHILAVTFTNKATEEMKQRIIRELNALSCGKQSSYLDELASQTALSPEAIRKRAGEARTKILHDYSHFAILTIDKFFQRIIRSFLKELGVDLNFNLELQTDSILDGAIDRMIEEITENSDLRGWITRFAEEKIDNNDAWDIHRDLRNLGEELFKERYKTMDKPLDKEQLDRITAQAIAHSKQIKNQLTQSAQSALELITRSGLTVEDFLFGVNGCAGYFVKLQKGEIAPYNKRVEAALESDKKWFAKNAPQRASVQAIVPQLRPLLAEACRLYDQNILFLNTAQLLAQNFRSYALLSDLSERIAALCREQGILPISETNGLLARLIGENDTPFIYEKTGNSFSHFMIDEFQDTSRQQWNNFVPLLENAVAQEAQPAVLLVGDIKQSIYRWRGGDWQILGEDVRQRFREVEEQQLETNYRSAQQIVRFNNELIEQCVRTDNTNLNETLQKAREEGKLSSPLTSELIDMMERAYRNHTQRYQEHYTGGFVRIRQFGKGAYKKKDEGVLRTPVIDTVEALQQRGYAPSQIAILVRTNSEGVRIAGELLDYKSAHPDSPFCYDLVTQEALTIGKAPVTNFILALFKLSVDPNDPIRRAVINRFLGRPLTATLPDAEQKLLEELRLCPIEEAFDEVVLHYALNRHSDQIAYIQAIEEQVHSFSSSKIADIPLFLKWWEETGCKQSIHLPQNPQALTIISIHKSKGLQYKAVVVPYCTWSLQPKTSSLLWATASDAPFAALGKIPVPYTKAVGNSYFSEEYYRETVLSHIDNLNTFYVAATRAEEELHLMLYDEMISGTIGSLIAGALQGEGSSARLGALQGRYEQKENETVYEFGEPFYHTPQTLPAAQELCYPVSRPDLKLKIHFNSQRYFDEQSAPQLTPRNYGILMHRIFAEIEHEEQIAPRLAAMRAEGTLSESERDRVEKRIRDAFENPIIRSWFSSQWSCVHNECEIIVPQQQRVRRPDRVVTRGSEAVVIDYKFGNNRSARHASQLAEYMKLLREMGYRTVQGYLWYIELETIEKVVA